MLLNFTLPVTPVHARVLWCKLAFVRCQGLCQLAPMRHACSAWSSSAAALHETADRVVARVQESQVATRVMPQEPMAAPLEVGDMAVQRPKGPPLAAGVMVVLEVQGPKGFPLEEGNMAVPVVQRPKGTPLAAGDMAVPPLEQGVTALPRGQGAMVAPLGLLETALTAVLAPLVHLMQGRMAVQQAGPPPGAMVRRTMQRHLPPMRLVGTGPAATATAGTIATLLVGMAPPRRGAMEHRTVALRGPTTVTTVPPLVRDFPCRTTGVAIKPSNRDMPHTKGRGLYGLAPNSRSLMRCGSQLQ